MTLARPYLLFVLALALLLFQAQRHEREIERIKTDRSVEFAAQVAEGVARTFRQPGPVCVEYRVHMERIDVTHCMDKAVRL